MNIVRLFEILFRKIKRFILNNKYKSILQKHEVIYSTLTFNGYIKFVLDLGCFVSFGKNFICSSGPHYSIDPSCISSINVKKNSILKIGDNSGMTGTSIHVHEKVIIGDNVNIGAGTLIFDTNFHSTDSIIRANRSIDLSNVVTAPIHIMNNVFIGARSIICKGVTIGENSIIGAGSVVIKDIPSNEIWGGNPATFIKKI
jgi:acetyltransferase-like isoleucine patch superfamily enzyme